MNFRRMNYFQGYDIKCTVRNGDCNFTDIIDNNFIGCSCNNTDPSSDIYGLFTPYNFTEVSTINFDVFACAGTAFVYKY
jgi:hypothetical protein